MKKVLKTRFLHRALAAILVIALCFCTISMEAFAESSSPSLNDSHYCEFIVANRSIPMFTSPSLSQRGYYFPYKVKDNAASTPGDIDKILSINGNICILEYPVGNQRVIGCCPLSDVVYSASLTKATATGKVTSYKKPGGESYGYFEPGDEVFIGGTDGLYTFAIYSAKSGSRAYKGAWFKTSSLNANVKINASTSGGNTSNWQWPVSNAYVCGNTWSEYYSVKGRDHLGVDIKSSNGDKTVRAAAAGKVYATGWNSANGNCIVIEHTLSGKTVYSFYAHLEKFTVSKGQWVNCGDAIGYVGNTGSGSTGPHLHFGISTQRTTGTWGYGTCFSNSANSTKWNGYTYYNPFYVINYDRLP